MIFVVNKEGDFEHVCRSNPYRDEWRPRIIWSDFELADGEIAPFQWTFRRQFGITSCPWCKIDLPDLSDLKCSCYVEKIPNHLYSYFSYFEEYIEFGQKKIRCKLLVYKFFHNSACPLFDKEEIVG